MGDDPSVKPKMTLDSEMNAMTAESSDADALTADTEEDGGNDIDEGHLRAKKTAYKRKRSLLQEIITYMHHAYSEHGSHEQNS